MLNKKNGNQTMYSIGFFLLKDSHKVYFLLSNHVWLQRKSAQQYTSI